MYSRTCQSDWFGGRGLTLITDYCPLCSSRGRDRQGPAPLPQPALPERLCGPRAAADHPGQPLPPHRPLWVTLLLPFLTLHPRFLHSSPWVRHFWCFSLSRWGKWATERRPEISRVPISSRFIQCQFVCCNLIKTLIHVTPMTLCHMPSTDQRKKGEIKTGSRCQDITMDYRSNQNRYTGSCITHNATELFLSIQQPSPLQDPLAKSSAVQIC